MKVLWFSFFVEIRQRKMNSFVEKSEEKKIKSIDVHLLDLRTNTNSLSITPLISNKVVLERKVNSLLSDNGKIAHIERKSLKSCHPVCHLIRMLTIGWKKRRENGVTWKTTCHWIKKIRFSSKSSSSWRHQACQIIAVGLFHFRVANHRHREHLQKQRLTDADGASSLSCSNKKFRSSLSNHKFRFDQWLASITYCANRNEHEKKKTTKRNEERQKERRERESEKERQK